MDELQQLFLLQLNSLSKCTQNMIERRKIHLNTSFPRAPADNATLQPHIPLEPHLREKQMQLKKNKNPKHSFSKTKLFLKKLKEEIELRHSKFGSGLIR